MTDSKSGHRQTSGVGVARKRTLDGRDLVAGGECVDRLVDVGKRAFQKLNNVGLGFTSKELLASESTALVPAGPTAKAANSPYKMSARSAYIAWLFPTDGRQ